MFEPRKLTKCGSQSSNQLSTVEQWWWSVSWLNVVVVVGCVLAKCGWCSPLVVKLRVTNTALQSIQSLMQLAVFSRLAKCHKLFEICPECRSDSAKSRSIICCVLKLCKKPLNMTLNPQYEEIGKGFVQQYYAIFDDPTQRPNLVNLYSASDSFMTFEGLQIQGAPKIMEKLTSLTFQKITRVLTTVDSQPTFDGGVLINVLGRLQCDDDPPHAFSQVFVLRPLGTTFFCAHDIFRLNIHDTA